MPFLHSGDCDFIMFHILVCLETESEVESFKTQALQNISKYASEIKPFKEESIKRIENYCQENEKYLSNQQKNIFEEIRHTGLGVGGPYR